jgi:protein-disulfide isomerase
VSTARWIDQTYVKTGQVRIVIKNFPVHGEPALKAAEAALCASDQEHFWDFHDRLLEDYYRGDTSAASNEGLKQIAADLGLNTTAFGTCLDKDQYRQQVIDEATEAQKLGVSGTPTFFINKQSVVGAQPIEEFKKVIDAALAGS